MAAGLTLSLFLSACGDGSADLSPGMCFNDSQITAAEQGSVTSVSCAVAHDDEIVGMLTGSVPSGQSREQCITQMGRRVDAAGLDFFALTPRSGSGSTLCVAFRSDQRRLNRPLTH